VADFSFFSNLLDEFTWRRLSK